MISTPISVQKQINSIVHQFIWSPDKIKRHVFSADYENGGLKMVDIVTKIKTQQIMCDLNVLLMEMKRYGS